MRYTVQEFIKSFKTCQQIKALNRKPYGLLQPIELPKSNREVITMDFVLQLPENKTSNSRILNVVDNVSKMIRITPIKSNITAPEPAMKFKHHIDRNHRLPMKIISD